MSRPDSRLARGALAALCLAAATGCSFLEGPRSCSQGSQPGVVVSVMDAGTGRFIADSASGTVVDGAYSENLVVGVPGQSLQGAFDRAGNYTVTVSRPGYLDWGVTNVIVTKGECHPGTTVLEARMEHW